jgi:spectinomycin phosphotransferase
MLEKPDVQDVTICACLRERYGVSVTELQFLPLGYDAYAWVYRVRAEDGTIYFAKLKRGPIDEAAVGVAHYLKNHGIEQVVAPLATTTRELWARLDNYTLLLYPFIEGNSGMASGLSDQQWIEYGAVLKRIHATHLTPDLLGRIRRETFIPNPRNSRFITEVLTTVKANDYQADCEREIVAFCMERRAELRRLVERAEVLGRLLQQAPPEYVLCHADYHTANILLDNGGRLFVVDWDQPILAPRECDLMFVVGATIGSITVGERDEELFFQGYGNRVLDWLALAYYRYNWAVQDIGEFGEFILQREDVGMASKEDAARLFRSLFKPGSTVETAYAAEEHLPPGPQSRSPN